MSKKIICKYIKLSSSGPVFAQLVEHNKGLTFVSGEPKEDKDFNMNNVPQAEKYIVNLGYKKVNDKSVKANDDRPYKWAIYYPAKFGGTREYYSNKDAAFKRAIHVAKRDNWTEEMKASIKIEEYGVEGDLLKTYSYQEYNKFVEDSMKDKLIQSGSKEALGKNIATEIKAGKDPKQAAAIAYSVQRKNDAFVTNKLSKTTGVSEPITKGLKDAIQFTKEPGTDKIIYVMQSDINKNLYFYIGKTYSMKDGEWTYAKYKMNGVSPESFMDELKKNGWHQVNKGPAKIIDTKTNKKEYTQKMLQQDINQINKAQREVIKDIKNKKITFDKAKDLMRAKVAPLMDDVAASDMGDLYKKLHDIVEASIDDFKQFYKDSGENMKRYNITYKDKIYNVKAKDHSEAIQKALKYNKEEQQVNTEDERLSPMTYKKLKEMGYGSDDWKNLTQEEANKIVAEEMASSNPDEAKTKVSNLNKKLEKISRLRKNARNYEEYDKYDLMYNKVAGELENLSKNTGVDYNYKEKSPKGNNQLSKENEKEIEKAFGEWDREEKYKRLNKVYQKMGNKMPKFDEYEKEAISDVQRTLQYAKNIKENKDDTIKDAIETYEMVNGKPSKEIENYIKFIASIAYDNKEQLSS